MHAWYPMDPLEVAGGWLHGFDPATRPPASQGGPREVLDRTLLRCLQRSPCVIAFSGGRDSSALLAAAVAVARREGLPLPVTLTLTYPGVPEADETQWQHQVLDHLGVRDRMDLTVHDEHDPLGPITAPLLRRHGALWPPNLAPTWRLMDRARGGVLIIGECGDEVFGTKRITPLRTIVRSYGRVDRRLYPIAARTLAPAVLRRRAMLRLAGRHERTWLRPAVRDLLARRDVADVAAFGLHAGRNVRQFVRRRAIGRSFDTHRALGREIDVEYVAPFAEPGFVSATVRASGFWGWSGRTAAMTAMFGDVLPHSILSRTSKATFEKAVFTERGREFARGWDGTGVDPELVDPEVLQQMWAGDQPDPGTMVLMQQAWLASRPAVSSRDALAQEAR